jgi:adenylate cyclase class 2
MAVEIEAKMKVADLKAIAQTLKKVGAKRKGSEYETNIFFDTEKDSLKKAGKGLRLRIAKNLSTQKTRYIITFKGPLQKGKLKTRQEIEMNVEDADAAINLFAALGFERKLSFEKRRETWNFQHCEVVLDELPLLGTYVEIEGPSNRQVMSARKALGLDKLPLIQTGYISMLATYLKDHRIADHEIRF